MARQLRKTPLTAPILLIFILKLPLPNLRIENGAQSVHCTILFLCQLVQIALSPCANLRTCALYHLRFFLLGEVTRAAASLGACDHSQLTLVAAAPPVSRRDQIRFLTTISDLVATVDTDANSDGENSPSANVMKEYALMQCIGVNAHSCFARSLNLFSTTHGGSTSSGMSLLHTRDFRHSVYENY